MYSKFSILFICLLFSGCATLLPKNYGKIETAEEFLIRIVENNRPPLSPIKYNFPKTRVDEDTFLTSIKYELWRDDENGKVDPVEGFSKFCTVKGGLPTENKTQTRQVLFCDNSSKSFLVIVYGSTEKTGSDIPKPFFIRHYISLVRGVAKNDIKLLRSIVEQYAISFYNIFESKQILIKNEINKKELLDAIRNSVYET